MNENYIKLLIAIEYSTNKDTKYAYGLYDVNKETVLMVSSDLKDIAKALNITYSSLCSMRTRNQLVKRRFELVKFEQEEYTIEDLLLGGIE